MGSMLPYIAAPWILWDIISDIQTYVSIERAEIYAFSHTLAGLIPSGTSYGWEKMYQFMYL